jgi:hypothetical protein
MMASEGEDIEAGWRDLEVKVKDAITKVAGLVNDDDGKQKEMMETYCREYLLHQVLVGLQVKDDGSHCLRAAA